VRRESAASGDHELGASHPPHPNPRNPRLLIRRGTAGQIFDDRGGSGSSKSDIVVKFIKVAFCM
jgi:hypothetical protein